MNKILGSLLIATMLFGAPSAQEVANQLKALEGKTLKNPVVFVKYGKGAFDWLAVTSDGKFAAKLNGLNPDGTFNYTILGNPAKYGLKLNVSLAGVEINVTSNNNSQSLMDLQKKVKAGERAFAALSWSLSNQISTPVRNIKKFSFLSKLFKSIPIPKYYTRTTANLSSQICTGGGSAIVTGTPTDYTLVFKNCKNSDSSGKSYMLLNGKEHVVITSGEKVKAELLNYTSTYYGYGLSNKASKLSLEFEDMKYMATADEEIWSGSNISFTYQVENKEIFKIIFDKYNQKEIQKQYIFSGEGKIRVHCLKGWTQFSTLSPIQDPSYNTYNNCPNKGLLEVKNDNGVTHVKINSDTSIDIIDVATNKVLKHYDNCEEIPGPFQICQNSNK